MRPLNDAEADIIGTRPPRAVESFDFGIFAQPAEETRDQVADVELAPEPSEHAERAAATDDAEKLLAIAADVAREILDRKGRVAMWEVRLSLARKGLLANDGKEKLDALGALGRRMRLVAVGSERAPAWAQRELAASHANRHTIWKRREVA